MWRRVASPELVGRERELAELESALRRAEAGEPAMVLVAGEAGIGKTRLVRQFTGGVPHRVWIGHCPPIGEGLLPYAPVIELLRAAVDDLGAPAVCERAGALWSKLVRLLPELGEPPAGPIPADASQAAQWAELLWLLNRLTQEPTVILVEDLHWADSSTRGLLNLLVRGATGRLLLICTYRDDELPPSHPLRSALAEWRRTGMERIALARLARDEVLGQVRAITSGQAGPQETDELYRRSDGNPFFVEELLAAGPDAARLPEGLRDVLLLRVRQLPPAARQAVGVVAVAGHSASHALLTRVLDATPEELSAGLGDAMDSHIMVASGDGYAFRHVLVGEAVVAEMLPGERIRLHRRIAEAHDAMLSKGIAPSARRALLAETAHHWLAAGEAGRALVSAIDAGLAAENTFALPEAHGHFQTALGLWGRAEHAHHLAALDLVGLYQHAAETAYLLDDMETALTLVQQGIERADAVADPWRVGQMYERKGRFMLASGKPTQATLDAYQKAVYLVPDEPTPERARVLAGFSAMVLGAARHEEAAGWAEQVVQTARQAGARREEARGLSTLGCSLVMLGRQDEGITRLRKALDVATEIQDPLIRLSSYINLSDALHNIGRFAEAADVALDGVDVFEGDSFQRGLYLCLLGNAFESLFWQGRWDELAARLQGIGVDHPDDTRTMHLNLWRVAAAYLTATGRFEEAESTLDGCRKTLGSLHLESAGQLQACLAELHLWRDEPGAAWACVEQALEILGDNCSHGPLMARLLAAGARARADLAAPGRPDDHTGTPPPRSPRPTPSAPGRLDDRTGSPPPRPPHTDVAPGRSDGHMGSPPARLWRAKQPALERFDDDGTGEDPARSPHTGQARSGRLDDSRVAPHRLGGVGAVHGAAGCGGDAHGAAGCGGDADGAGAIHGAAGCGSDADGDAGCGGDADAHDDCGFDRGDGGDTELELFARRIAELPKSLQLTSLAEAHLSQAVAELARTGLETVDAVEAWERTAELWRDLGSLPAIAYARWRQAEALLSAGARRQAAEAPLSEAYTAAVSLGADPLRREIEALARRARLELEPEADERAEIPFGLTARELDVLAVLAEGQTNRQIAKRLFISEKTVSIHVSRILAKLDVPNRAAAVATAHRLGLD